MRWLCLISIHSHGVVEGESVQKMDKAGGRVLHPPPMEQERRMERRGKMIQYLNFGWSIFNSLSALYPLIMLPRAPLIAAMDI